MSRNTSVSLGQHFEKFVSCQVEAGRFGSASEMIRAGLRLLEERELKIISLRNALIEGEKSGIADYSLEAINRELDDESLD